MRDCRDQNSCIKCSRRHTTICEQNSSDKSSANINLKACVEEKNMQATTLSLQVYTNNSILPVATVCLVSTVERRQCQCLFDTWAQRTGILKYVVKR